MNNDGVNDIIAGSYSGDIYFFEGEKNGTFKTPKLVKDPNGEAIGKSSCVIEPFDMDNDGDLDLVSASRVGEGKWYENIGTKNAFQFENKLIKLIGATREGVRGSHLHFVDWDNDGLADIISGDERGTVNFYRNVGSKLKPVFGSPQKLLGNSMSGKGERSSDPHGGRVKVHVYDYDGDGRLDILLGDSVSKKVEGGPPLTAKEKSEKKKLNNKLKQLRNEIDDEPLYEKLRKASAEKDKESYDKISKEIEILNKPISDLYGQLKKYKRGGYTSHGWVWFYRQLEAK